MSPVNWLTLLSIKRNGRTLFRQRGAACFILISICCLVAGCGYHHAVSNGRGAEFAGRGVHIPIFVNKSYRPGLEAILSNSLVDEFALRSGGRVVGKDAAKLILSGTILSYAVTPLSYTAVDKIKEYRATIKAEAVLSDRENHHVLWKGVLAVNSEYPANTNISLQQNSEEAAAREICRRLAEQIYEKIDEDF